MVTKREKLRFFDSKPLFGKNIVVTRSREQSSKMVAQIAELGGNAIEYPTIKIEPIPENVDALAENFGSLDRYSHIIFTSTNGVEIFFDALKASGRDTRALGSIHVTAIGSATAALLAEQGITADFVPKKYVGEELVDGLMPLLTETSRVLIPRSKNARIYVVEALRKVCPVDEYQIYETVREDNTDVDVAEMLKNKEIDYITFTSSTTVQYFVEKIGSENVDDTKNAKCVSIGPVTSDKMKELGLTVDVQAEVYTIAGMIEAILNMEK